MTGIEVRRREHEVRRWWWRHLTVSGERELRGRTAETARTVYDGRASESGRESAAGRHALRRHVDRAESREEPKMRWRRDRTSVRSKAKGRRRSHARSRRLIRARSLMREETAVGPVRRRRRKRCLRRRGSRRTAVAEERLLRVCETSGRRWREAVAGGTSWGWWRRHDGLRCSSRARRLRRRTIRGRRRLFGGGRSRASWRRETGRRVRCSPEWGLQTRVSGLLPLRTLRRRSRRGIREFEAALGPACFLLTTRGGVRRQRRRRRCICVRVRRLLRQTGRQGSHRGRRGFETFCRQTRRCSAFARNLKHAE